MMPRTRRVSLASRCSFIHSRESALATAWERRKSCSDSHHQDELAAREPEHADHAPQHGKQQVAGRADAVEAGPVTEPAAVPAQGLADPGQAAQVLGDDRVGLAVRVGEHDPLPGVHRFRLTGGFVV